MSYDPLVSLPQVKQWLGYTDNTADGALAALISASSELIGRYCSRDNLGAVITATEFYYASRGTKTTLILNRYPVTAVMSITINGTPQTVLTDPSSGSGFYLHTDKRTLLYLNGILPWPANVPAKITYSAGYTTADIPKGLQQACIQHVGEITKSASWIGYRSKSLAGETVTFDTGADKSMSPRTLAMLRPYMDVLPSQGIG